MPDGLVRVREQYLVRRVAWREQQWQWQRADPNLSPSQQKKLTERISSPDLSSQGVDINVGAAFPTGTRPEDLANYPDIVRAFSRTFGPNLFEELSLADPFPGGDPYWSNLFATLTQTSNLQVYVHKSDSTFCLGMDGGYQPGSGVMELLDCTGEDDIFHEIGHVVMEEGILKGRAPLYFHYATAYSNEQPQFIDSRDMLATWFGKELDKGVDIDGTEIGFVSDYATPKMHVLSQRATEDFAETFKFYVSILRTSGKKSTGTRTTFADTEQEGRPDRSTLYRHVVQRWRST